MAPDKPRPINIVTIVSDINVRLDAIEDLRQTRWLTQAESDEGKVLLRLRSVLSPDFCLECGNMQKACTCDGHDYWPSKPNE